MQPKAPYAHLLIGDGHYRGEPGEAMALTRLLTRALAQGATELSILGDFFDLWVALPQTQAPGETPLVTVLRSFKARGLKLRYVVGNRDYLVPEWNTREHLFDEVVTESVTLDTPAGLLHLAHGDLVNLADRPYRSWRAFSRGPLVHGLAHALPKRAMLALANRMAQRLKHTNQRHKSYFPEAALRDYARRLPDAPATLVFGHFHLHREFTEGNKHIVTLPYLGGDNAGVLITSTGLHRLNGKDPQQVG